MQVLNLANIDKSDIKYTISRFPDGEIQITLKEFTRKDTIKVMCRITNVDELFLVKQVFDILDRNDVVYDVFISYLMGMRMDRVMDFNRPFTLKIVANILKNSNAREFEILEPHSSRTYREFGTYEKSMPEVLNRLDGYQIVIPDAGAKDRYEDVFFYDYPADTIFCSKVRDIETGEILRIQVDNPEVISDRPMMILDDLCDGGGTFLGIAEAIRIIKPDAKLNINIVHAVNGVGLQRLSGAFDHVYITNSYKDWKKSWEHQPTPFPENITQIDVI